MSESIASTAHARAPLPPLLHVLEKEKTRVPGLCQEHKTVQQHVLIHGDVAQGFENVAFRIRELAQSQAHLPSAQSNDVVLHSLD